MTATVDCLCAGIIVADMVCQPIASMPPSGALIKTDRIEFAIGGCSANMAVDMVKLGMRVGLSGRVGNDLFGREVRHLLSEQGVDTSRLEVSDKVPTSSTFVLNVKGDDRRFIHCVGANAEYDGLNLSSDEIRLARSIFIGGFGLMESLTTERAIRLFQIAREANVITALNVVIPQHSNLGTWLVPVLPWTDYFFCNDDEADRITGESDPIRQAESLHELGAKTAIVTRGDKGAILIGPNARLRAGVYNVTRVDGTGTGDAFASGFLDALLRGEEIAQCLKSGTAMGASCVRSMGATTGVFNSAQLTEFIKTQPLSIESF